MHLGNLGKFEAAGDCLPWLNICREDWVMLHQKTSRTLTSRLTNLSALICKADAHLGMAINVIER